MGLSGPNSLVLTQASSTVRGRQAPGPHRRATLGSDQTCDQLAILQRTRLATCPQAAVPGVLRCALKTSSAHVAAPAKHLPFGPR